MDASAAPTGQLDRPEHPVDDAGLSARAPWVRNPLDAGSSVQRDAGAASDARLVFDVDAVAPREHEPKPGTRTILVREIPEAENLFFTASGRLFVSGGENVFEIERGSDGRWNKTDLFHETCLVEGIVETGDHLYGVCSRTGLDDFANAYFFGGEITESPELRILTRLPDGGIPNGLTVDVQGRVYTSCSGTGEILRITLSSPLKVAAIDVWARDLTFVNGLKIVDDRLYFTSLSADLLASRMGRMAIAPDGSAGEPEYLYERELTVLDDLLPYAGGFVITDYLAGTLVFWRDGQAYDETPPGTFFSPTAVAVGRPPMFSERDLLVTEKGVIFVEDAPDEGDLLSVYRSE